MNFVPKITLYERKDIEILIAFLLKKIGGMSKEELLCCTVDKEYVRYFDMICCLMDMEEKEIIVCEHEGDTERFYPTAKSNYLVIELGDSLPISLREDALYCAQKITARMRLENSVKCEIISLEKGYQLYIRFINETGGEDLMELKIFAPTLAAAEQMERRFFDNPAGAYRSVLNSFIQGYLTVSEAEIQEALE
ncbi:MAG: DUF4364 family protein [Eubacterium sp.]|nr:DUF4364 family protein [Eubacterium sp.]